MKTAFLLLFSLINFTGSFAQDTLHIYFNYNSYEVTLSQKKSLLNQVSQWKISSISLLGYTDEIGEAEPNIILAQNRITTVKNILSSTYAIESEVAIGEDNSTITDAKKRRVDIIITRLALPTEIPPVVEEPVAEIAIHKVEIGKAIQLKIQFEPGLDYILASSRSELEFLAQTLKDNPTYTVKLNGHVCCQNDYNLSLNRALRVKEFLVTKAGISESRITYEGFSNSKPLVEERTEADRIKNRRVEAIFNIQE